MLLFFRLQKLDHHVCAQISSTHSSKCTRISSTTSSNFLYHFLEFARICSNSPHSIPKIIFAIILLLTKLVSNAKIARFNDKIPRNHGKLPLNLAILTLLTNFANNKIILIGNIIFRHYFAVNKTSEQSQNGKIQ
jgi:hypothetical protein